ncbi:PREDICTED: HMG-Y-related [Prunus dulcis]|uniref:PREDICTED: HMG-Y-related n=1 Tax=Prunus dulcis TaxID=3755 RepID=A0A5E4G279_PRUDU|nr:uncharacterized protein LOC117622211 [Prunus dulcis]VVA33806.1 PREDICTED: HMG-Y-related [Prunus dulcis]
MHVHFCSLTLKPQTMATLKPHQPLHHQNIKDQRQKRIICKLRDALLTRIAASSEPSKPIINSEGLKSNIDRRLQELIPTVHTPTHPPYASMIQRAIEELDEEGGLSEVAISEFIKREYEDLPVAHEGFLRHHLRKLCESRVVVNLEGRRYNLAVEEGVDGGVVDRESTSERWPGREDRREIERMEEKMKGEEWQSEVMRRLDVQKQEHFEVIENKCEAQGKQMEVNEEQLEMASMELDVEGSSNKEAILGDIESEVYENEVIQGNHHREEQQSGEVYKRNEPQAQEIEVIENHFQPQAGKVREIGERVQGQDIEVRTKILELCCHENLRTQGDVPLADQLQQSPVQGQEKRRRGRPRKPRKGIESTRALVLLAPEIHHEEEPPKRRGMPRKAKKDMDASTRALMPCGGPQHHDEEQPPRLGDRPPKAKKNMDVSISALLPSDPEHHDEEQPPRRQGRRPKPKPDSETSLAVVSCSDKQQPQYRGRGRPPKPKPNSETSLAVVSCSDKQQQQQPQYRGRGRPPKPKPNSETNLAVVSCSDKQQKQPQYRGRGRHPKPKLDAEKAKNPPQTPQIEQLQQKRRGRGRPSKLQ